MMTTPPRTRTRAPAATQAPPAPAKPAPATKAKKPAAPAVHRAPKPSAVGALKAVAAAANKKMGEGTFVPAKDAFSFIRYIPYGHLIGDLCGLGGMPEGQSAMFIGKEGAGKTSQALKSVQQVQLKYPHHSTFWGDSEQTFDPLWAQQRGVDLDRMHLVSTVVGEDLADLYCDAMTNAEDMIFGVIDSANQMTPQKEYADSIGDAQVSLHARLMGRFTSHITSAQIERRRKGWLPVTTIFVNQWRSAIGGSPKGPKQTMPGGRQLAHFCSTHIDFRSKVESERDEAGNETPYIVEHVFNMKRSKGSSSLRQGEYSVVVGADHPLPIGSFDEAGTILSQAKRIGLWNGAGTNQRFDGYDLVFRKMDEGIDWLEDNPDEAIKIKRTIIMHHRQRLGLRPIPYDGYLLGWV